MLRARRKIWRAGYNIGDSSIHAQPCPQQGLSEQDARDIIAAYLYTTR
jgi:hypothetical protein